MSNSSSPLLDERKVRRLARSMRWHGWRGAPLVLHDGHVLGGLHRLHAMRRAGLPDAPAVHLDEVFREDGLDFAALHHEHGAPALHEGRWHELMARLSPRIRRKYGLEGRCRDARRD